MANIESKISVTRNGSDLEITSIVSVPATAADRLIEYISDRTDYWLESMNNIPQTWQVSDMVNRLGLRDATIKANLVNHINSAFSTAAGVVDEDDDSWYDEMDKAIKDALENFTDEEKGKILSDYVGRNLGEVEYALENPCCCYGMDHIEDECREIVMKKVMPEKAMPTLAGLEAALLEYVDETPPKQVTLERLQAIVTAVFMGSSTLVGAGNDIGDEPTGWNPK